MEQANITALCFSVGKLVSVTQFLRLSRISRDVSYNAVSQERKIPHQFPISGANINKIFTI